MEDDPRSDRPSVVITDEMCQVVKAFVLADRRVKVDTIAYEMSTSEGSTLSESCTINSVYLKVSCRMVPQMLTPLQKQSR